MTKDELLKYATENYPAGTKYKCPANIGGDTHGLGINIVELGDEIKFRNNDEIDIIYKGYIYYKGKWAEILEKPKVETKFEVGKWYKNLGVKENYIAKFKKIEKNTIWVCEDYIYKNSFHSTSGELTYSFSNAIECSLEEIQQYLPDGHPDKFTTSVAKEFVLPKHWFLRFKTKEVFDELCAKYAPEFEFYGNAGICNNINEPKLGNYYYLPRGASFGEEITFDQFKKYVLKQEVKEEVKPIERWSVDSYIVALENCCIGISNFNTGDIAIVLNNKAISLLSDNSTWSCDKDRDINYNDVKWFPTLQEAQKFSDELLGKNKTNLSVEDLVKGEFYFFTFKGYCDHIVQYAGNCRHKYDISFNHINDYAPSFNKNTNSTASFNDGTIIEESLRKASSNEIKWLKICIKQDKFIPKEELDKYDDEGNLMEKNEEYPEYVECIEEIPPSYGKLKQIYKVIDWQRTWSDCLLEGTTSGTTNRRRFKPSTKEAYEAQFNKDDKFKNGDWLVYIEYCGYNPSTPIKIGDVRQMIEGGFGSLAIYGVKDLSQYFRRALPHEIPVNNSIKEKPKLVFPYKVGDKIRCIKLNTWIDTFCVRHPTVICEGKVVEITIIGDFDEKYECIPFAATYNGVEYGFSYSDDNKYELVEKSVGDAVIANYMDIFNKLGMLPLITPKECYLNKQEVKNPLDDSEREVNINFSKPKQIKL